MLATFIQADPADLESLVAMRIAAMRASLEGVGRFDAQRARERLVSGFHAPDCFRLQLDGRTVGFFTLVRQADVLILKHLYVLPGHQGAGLGAQVIRRIQALAARQALPVQLGALRGSDANRFYQRHGFVQVAQEEWDIHYRYVPTPTPPAARRSVQVQWLVPADLPQLELILRQHVRDLHTGAVVDAEIAAIHACMRGAPDQDGRWRSYLVARDVSSGTALGCMALALPEARMAAHFSAYLAAHARHGLPALELLNAFVHQDVLRGQGVGRALLDAIGAEAVAAGAGHLLVNSGPRYRASWGFYDRTFDGSHGLLADYYGLGRHAQSWCMRLDSASPPVSHR